MTITAKVIEDSISKEGVVLTTLQLCYPRFIHSELLTHRDFSRNASSSRAIPVAKMIEQVRTNPAMPVHWGANEPGMQAGEELFGDDLRDVKSEWLFAAGQAADSADFMMHCNAHKQVVNRILEPFLHIHVIVTSTEWINFFELRDHKDADPTFHELAIQMKEAMQVSTPKILKLGEWHLPYVTPYERLHYPIEDLRKMSSARCARVSYLNHDGNYPDIDKDIALYNKLIVMKPSHSSPVEHQATPDTLICTDHKEPEWGSRELHGNFNGWIQFRKVLENNKI